MKTALVLTAAAATLLSTMNTAQADEPLLSPRAKANQIRTVTGTSKDKLDRSITSGSPKGIAMAESLRKVASAGPTVDLAHGPSPTLSPKDPRYEQAVRELREAQFQVAPLK
ncbi:MAG: hypothetical protein AB7O66_22365 [Limisphaerales bacterium]